MRQYDVGKKGILIDLGREHEILSFERKLLEDNPAIVTETGEIRTAKTMFSCAKPVRKAAQSGRNTIFINAGDTYTMTIISGKNDPTWANWHEFYAGMVDSIFARTGLSIVAAISAGGGTWIECHVYPSEIYKMSTYQTSDGIATYIDRPIAVVKNQL